MTKKKLPQKAPLEYPPAALIPRPAEELAPPPRPGVEGDPEFAPIDQESKASSERIGQTFLRDVLESVQYAPFAGRLTIPEFNSLLKLAVSDRFLGIRGDALEEHLGAPPDALRARPEYAELDALLAAGVEYAAKPQSLKEHLNNPTTQDALARRSIRLALHAGDARVSQKMLSDLFDRVLPRQTKEAIQKVVLIRAEDLERIERVLAELEDGRRETITLPAEAVSLKTP